MANRFRLKKVPSINKKKVPGIKKVPGTYISFVNEYDDDK